MKIAMPRLFRPRASTINRSFERYACEIDSAMTLIDRLVTFEGRIIDVSRGGALFRPKLAFIMRRSDQPVCLAVAGDEHFGLIVATSPAGFSIRFDEPIDAEDFAELARDLEAQAVRSAAA